MPGSKYFIPGIFYVKLHVFYIVLLLPAIVLGNSTFKILDTPHSNATHESEIEWLDKKHSLRYYSMMYSSYIYIVESYFFTRHREELKLY